MRAAILLTGILSSTVLGADYLLASPYFGADKYFGLLLDPHGGSIVLAQNDGGKSGNDNSSSISLQGGSLILSQTYDYIPRVVQVAVTNTSELVIADGGFANPPYVEFSFTSNGTLVYGDDKQDGFCEKGDAGQGEANLYLAPKGFECNDIGRYTFTRVQRDF
ncbi:uncharacterized protein TRUGW13939_04602 [Talaromyces rugulosus]|uniref:Uncharacterized protein n=1 Tax=Talaromyces rugulosus TaxID=121627 RepID=A0A7H8QUT3_TALRU|nr:uncharacterized protein TRUGW13939_04602 [Talaromyces rugulosus]QKX57488.1 hypothetical protein TRUGW13939_04602 [Talaromyces rugulosus]